MCGILGVISKDNNIKEDNFKINLDKLKSRGPDHTGIFKNNNIILGHTRLSIIDTSSSANQPFKKDENIVIFNGEIYNFKILKEKLKKIGYKFSTISDTEVLLYSYMERGEKCVEQFDGMRAFAIYNEKKQTIFISRDSIGEKPLIYYYDKNKFIFGSELTPILGLLDKKSIEINKKVISNFDVYNFRHIPFPYTPFKNIFKLEPGHNISMNSKTLMYQKYKYTSIDGMTIEKDSVKQCDKLLSQAVKQTCFADVPVGIFLSGGVDSSLIAAMMKDRDITTYSLGYDKDDEELKRAKKISKHLGLKNKQIYFGEYFKKSNFLDTLKRVIKHYGEPINLMQIIYSDIILKEMKKDGIIVAVGGNGADEIFYGYDGMNKLALISKIKSILDIVGLKFLIPNYKIKKYLYINDLNRKKYIKKRYRKFVYKDIITKIGSELLSNKLVDIFSWIGFRIENEHSITIVNDVAGSINSMELRTPFLNKDIVNFACSLDIKHKIKSYKDKRENKYILKKVLENYLPSDLVYFSKMGFGYNVKYEDLIFNKDNIGAIDNYFYSILPSIDIYKTKDIHHIYEKYKQGEHKYFQSVIAVLIVCIWYESIFLQK